MWIDPSTCKHYPVLKDVLSDLQQVFSKVDFLSLRNDPCVTNWSTDPNDNWVVNWSINLYNKNANIDSLPAGLQEVAEKISNIPDCYQSFLNFVAPGTIIPQHKDNKNLGNIVGPDKSCYQVVLCIQIPSNDPEVCGTDNGGEIRSYSTGDIVSFDGMVDHWIWNYSDQWRITACVDIFTDAFDLKD